MTASGTLWEYYRASLGGLPAALQRQKRRYKAAGNLYVGWGYPTPENVPKGVSAAATGVLERREGQALGAARSRASGEDTGA